MRNATVQMVVTYPTAWTVDRVLEIIRDASLEAGEQQLEISDLTITVPVNTVKPPTVGSKRGDWVHEDFDPHSELTKERDGYRADAEAERHREW